MISLESVEAINVLGQIVSLTEVLNHLHQQGRLQTVLQETAIRKVLELASDEFGVRPDSRQLQVAADDFRRTKGLLTADEMHDWLGSRRLTVGDFEKMIEFDLIRQTVFDIVVIGARSCFEKAREQWDMISLLVVDVMSEGLALEMKSQVLEDGTSFSEVAKEQNVNGSGASILRAEKMFRGHFNRRLSVSMIKAEPGELIGPVPTHGGWMLVQVDSVTCAEYSEETQMEIRKELFNTWLNSRLSSGPLSFPILDLLSCSNDS